MSHVGAVILAAGAGSRFSGGTHKLRADLAGRSVLEHSIEAVLGAGYDEVFVVIGQDDFADLLPDTVTTVPSPNWSAGQAHSVRAGIAAARLASFDAVVIAPGDQPLIGTATWTAMRTADATPWAVATYGEKRRPPTRIAASVWGSIPQDGDRGALAVLEPAADIVTPGP